ncbi:beta-lactamase [Paenibacillus swuensis]|uniref:Beta-lactamase n=1 Tax=Paenibacillus swuensis TaxID=1178515 RepID=A0A172TKA9_9BACL|nr:MBL fold metallo-hydrolase [Paenibacillus swuensis]ANE47412.1 beta-lactamase [Paenibacillus swuensis]
MGITLEMMGTGSAFAKNYFNNNALLYVNDATIMIDCGITAPAALHKMGKSFGEIDAVIVTHLHADHIGGLEEFAFQMKFLYERKPKIIVPEALLHPLWENSLRAGLEQEGIQSLDCYFEVYPVKEREPFAVTEGLTIEYTQTEHIPGKLSYSLFIGEHTFYSADLQFDLALLEYVHHERKCRTILHDCQLSLPGVVHAGIDQLLTLPTDIQRKIYLMHYGDNMPDFEGKTGEMRFIRQHKTIVIENVES